MSDLTGVVSLGEAPSEPAIPGRVGAFPVDAGFASAGRVKFGKAWFASAIEGELNFIGAGSSSSYVGEDPHFHGTDTIDMEFCRRQRRTSSWKMDRWRP